MLTIALRILLIVAALGLIAFLLYSIKKSKMGINDSMFWIGFSLLILLLSVFPEIASFFSGLLGFIAPVNFVFIFFIFILIVRDFFMNRRISQLENRVKELTQQIALDKLDHYARTHREDDEE